MYFRQLPLVLYPDIQNPTNNIVLTNILTRSSFLKELQENIGAFYSYQVKEGETPEQIADKLYGDPNRHWIVLLFNRIMNPLYEFPLTQAENEELIKVKYSQSLAASLTTIRHYEQRVTREVLFNNILQSSTEDIYVISATLFNQTTGAVEATPSLPGSADTSTTVGTTTESFPSGIKVKTTTVNHAISNYTYEETLNEARRTINLLDTKYVVSVEVEFKRLMRDAN
jgi:transcriptional regulator